MVPLLILFAVAAFGLSSMRAKHDPYAVPFPTYNGKVVDTTPANLKTGASSAELESWATAQGFRKVDPVKTQTDEATMAVLRDFLVRLSEARKANNAPALFATMRGNPFAAGVANERGANAYVLLP